MKEYMLKESKLSLIFRHWVMANYADLRSSTFEIKQTATNTYNFAQLKDHQNEFSQAIKWGKKGVLIRNESGTTGAPDYSYYKNAPAFIVIFFKQGFVLIDIDTYNLEKEKRKSINWARATEISWKTVVL